MNPETGHIYQIPLGEEPNPRDIPLTEKEAKILKQLTEQERVDLYVRMNAAGRRQARRQKHRKGELP